MSKGDEIWIKLMRLGHLYGCHQIPERCFTIRNRQFPICARCSGVLFGQIIGIILIMSKVLIPLCLALLFIGVMGIDWLIQFLNIRKSTNLRRFISGTLCGVGLIYFYAFITKAVITAIQEKI